MYDDHDTSRVDAETVLRGIFALLLAERLERQGHGPRTTERILASAGLDEAQIAALTDHDAKDRPTIGHPALPWHPAVRISSDAPVRRA
jgi:hypothetical protein